MKTSAPNQLIAFDRFEVDLRSGEILRSGRRVRLQSQPFQVLVLLLQHPGEVVTREEICRTLWHSDTFVDFDHSLGTAINKVREALGDSAEQPRFIETLPRRGYRFIGDIAPLPPTSAPIFSSQVAVKGAAGGRSSHPSRALLGIALCSFAIIGFAVAVWAVSRWFRRVPEPVPASVYATPFTTFSGNETAPAFSPDGSQIAFAWDGDPRSGDKGFDLYLKGMGSETVLRLTHHPSKWISPAWSPDGTQIAFHRISGVETGIYVVPALGGPERKLHSTRVPYDVAAPISWSPNGKWIAFGDPLPTQALDRIFLLSMETLQTLEIPHNPECLHEAVPTFSHRGDKLAYICVHSLTEFELYSVDPWKGTPKLITKFANIPPGFSWSADDTTLILSQSSDSGSELDEVRLADGSLRRLDFGPNATWPAISPRGDKLAYSAFFGRTTIWRKDLINHASHAEEFIRSTRDQGDAQFSPDGKHIAFQSSRAGSWDIWMSDVDGNNVLRMTRLDGIASVPRWSPDGKKIAFELHQSGRFEIYVVDIADQVARKLATNDLKMFAPSWSRDGKWIYFRSSESIGQRIYRCPANGGHAVALGGQPDGTFPQESVNGDVLYFATRLANTGLTALSLKAPASETAVEGFPAIAGQNLWTLGQQGVYFVPAQNPKSLNYFDFATKTNHQIFGIEKDFGRLIHLPRRPLGAVFSNRRRE